MSHSNSNPHLGTTLDDLLAEDGLLDDVEQVAAARVADWQSNSRVVRRTHGAFAWLASWCGRLGQRLVRNRRSEDGARSAHGSANHRKAVSP